MTTTTRLQQILAQIRTNLSGRSSAGGKAAAPARGQHPETQSRASIEELQAQIGAGLAALDIASPQGKRQARRVFLESVLLNEFGVTLANDPRFTEIVRGVQDSFEQEQALLAQLDAVLEDLRRAA